MVDRPRGNSPSQRTCIGVGAQRERESAGPPLYHCASYVFRWPVGLTCSAIAVRMVLSLTGQGGSGREDSHNLSVIT